MAIIKFSGITFTSIKNQIENFLRKEYNITSILYSPSSPYGQILSVIENLYQMSLLYLKNAIDQFDLSLTTSANTRIIKNAALLAGHNPGRSISATGTLRLNLKTDVSIESEIPGRRITFRDKTLLTNNTNGLNYSIVLNTDTITESVGENKNIFLPIIQGEWKQQNFTGTGKRMQSYSLSEKGNTEVENFNVEVIVDGDIWVIKNHLYEMIPEEKSCVVKTGFNSGIDVIFGNGNFGAIPPIGSSIEVNYLSSNGSSGNIFRRTENDFTFVDEAFDGNGESINISNVFNVFIYNDINFGADKEDPIFTKSLLPITSQNFVLGLPQQYAYEIKKLGVFSHVNAYERNGTIFIVATPNVRLFRNQNSDYFTVDINAFTLDEYEKRKIRGYLEKNGKLQLTKRYRIDSPDLSYYVLNVYVIPYSDTTSDSIDNQITEKISDYFLNLNRMDRIPKLDLIKELSTIRDIHSIDIQFISKKNEDYHREYIQKMKNKIKNAGAQLSDNINIKQDPNYDPEKVYGLDYELGDIIFEPNELPIIRGGWKDRNNRFYSDDPEATNEFKSINIIKKGTIDYKKRPNV